MSIKQRLEDKRAFTISKKRLIFAIIVFIALLPLWMWLAWLLTPKTKLVVAIIDKTVLTPKGQEHISFDWILNHNRYTKTRKESYDPGADYFGFFPMPDEQFKIKGLERFSASQLNRLSDDADMVYVTDTYGIYKNEWYSGKNVSERSGMLYGGMSANDVALLRDMKSKHKLVVAEFNSIASPTTELVRSQFEQQFGMKWSGWTARFFESFDTLRNKELPKWLTRSYKRDNNNKWPFHRGGIAFVSNDDRVAILEDSTHLTNPVPQIITLGFGQKNLRLPAKYKYPFWFDVIIPDLSINHVVSRFDINLNKQGIAELKKYGIPPTFPAILMHNAPDYQFYYFSGDFCDNPINITTSYFKGINFFKSMFYDAGVPSERSGFFWNFYQPLMNNILNDYISGKNKTN
jgi:hypothetical protein